MKIQEIETHYKWGYTVLMVATNDEGTVLGCINLEFVKGEEYSFVYGLRVQEEYRKQGTGSELLRYCEEKTLESGRNAVRLDIEADDDYAEKFYTKRGYGELKDLAWGSKWSKYRTFNKKIGN